MAFGQIQYLFNAARPILREMTDDKAVVIKCTGPATEG